jgi:demethoxyubiquinone hydroxylase (CLK1/Coq7/Cat5 family)
VLLKGDVVASKQDKETVELMEWISKFHDEKQEHHDTDIREDAEQTPGYEIYLGSSTSSRVAARPPFGLLRGFDCINLYVYT